MYKVKIIGAGSIGNHMAQASRRMGWSVDIVDTDPKSLQRTKEDIYPKRYGAWDDSIGLYEAGKEPKGTYDIVIIGTPPDSHMKLAIAALAERPKLLHIEKPLCAPSLDGVDEFIKARKESSETSVLVGYDHAVAESIEYIANLLGQKTIGNILTMDVEFREHWKGIFGAHPWLAGPWETYLGYWRRGGGAGCEHSHALHLWQYFAGILGTGFIKDADAMFAKKEEKGAEYDYLAAFHLTTDSGFKGRVVQDVITYPVRKWLRLQGDKGFIEWYCNGKPEGDLVKFHIDGQEPQEKVFPKKRPDDFYREMLHYADIISGKIKEADSPLSFEKGLAVMKILNKAYLE